MVATSAFASLRIPFRAYARVAESKGSHPGAAQDREIAARFAPVFYQSVGPQRRNDLITNFDFDGDWRGDNNWANAGKTGLPLKAYVYYGVSETLTHYFIHYAVFHPRDYKGGSRGKLLSELLRQGAKRGGRLDPTGMAEDAAFAHENDMEGCLVVVAKNGADPQRASVTFVETMAHNHFLRYVPGGDGAAVGYETVRVDDQRPELYIEPKGHGIKSNVSNAKSSERRNMLVYRFTGSADNPDARREKTVGYELLPIYETLWARARGGVNETYGAIFDYASINVDVAQKSGQTVSRKFNLGVLGAAFAGKVGAKNMARPPWGWFDRNERGELTGRWFFDPAQTIKRHFNPAGSFSLAYLHAPFLGVFRP